jgi:hypothetical protein
MRRKSLILLLFSLATLSIAAGQGAKPPVPPKVEPGLSLSAARLAVQKTVGSESLPLWLRTYALALPASEALTLCREFLPKASASDKPGLASFASSLALVAGRVEDAAFFLAYPGKSRPDMLLLAVRCNLAIGRTQTARTLLGQLPAEMSPASAEKTTIVSAWIALIENSPAKAFELVSPLLFAEGKSATRREALFLAWLSLSSQAQATTKVDTILTELKADFPDSLEYALAKGKVRPQPSAWLLEGLYPQSGKSAVTDRSLATKAQGEASGDDAQLSASRLQVGWFSKKENGLALMNKLKGKGFSASIDEQATSEGEPRWAVIIEASGDWSKTQAQLKDLGYESYLLP